MESKQFLPPVCMFVGNTHERALVRVSWESEYLISTKCMIFSVKLFSSFLELFYGKRLYTMEFSKTVNSQANRLQYQLSKPIV